MSAIASWFKKLFGGIPSSPPDTAASASQATETAQKGFRVVRIQPTPNPDAFQYIVNGKVIASGTRTFNSAEEAQGDPFAEALFQIYGVESVFLKENFVTVSKSKVVGWHTVMERIGEAIQEHLVPYETGDEPEKKQDVDPVLEEFKKEDFPQCSDEEKTRIIEALLDVAIRPALANDGGGINVLGIEGNLVKVHYQGACGSCPSSTAGTLHYIESFLKEALHPDLKVEAN